MVIRDVRAFDSETEVLILGSGSGGLPAALAASTAGAETVVLEKAPYVGGTTAVSSGILWVPNSDAEVELYGRTPTEEVVAYVRRVAGPAVPEDRIVSFVETAPEAVRFIEDHTPLEFEFVGLPDYHPEWEYGYARGRSIEPSLYDAGSLGDRSGVVRESPYYPYPVTKRELEATSDPFFVQSDEVQARIDDDIWALGRALIGGLFEGCLAQSVTVHRNSAATELIVNDDRVCGVVAESDGTRVTYGAEVVLLATGGLPWDEEMRENFLRGPMDAPAAVPSNTGDGITMGMDVGAKLGNMNEAWWFPTARDPSESWADGTPLYRQITGERTNPGSLMVNESGERFCNEAGNYHDLGKTLHAFDQESGEYVNLPAYLIVDRSFRETYSILTVDPDDPDPDWLVSAPSLVELAAILGIDEAGLVETIEEFNSYASDGKDPLFHRGESAHDRIRGDGDADHPTLGPVSAAPFYAIEILPGSIGTKGGVVTTPEGAVVDVRNDEIPGLFAASNGTAHVMGRGYPGSGGTLGPNVTFGYIAGLAAAKRVTGE